MANVGWRRHRIDIIFLQFLAFDRSLVGLPVPKAYAILERKSQFKRK